MDGSAVDAEAARDLLDRAAPGGQQQLDELADPIEDRGVLRRFVAVPPAALLQALLTQRQNELDRAKLELDSLDEIYRAATLGRAAAEVVDVIHGTETIRERVGHIQPGARKEVLNLVKAPFFSSGNMTDDAVIGRGVRYRVIVERSMLDGGSPSFDEIIQARAAGEVVRIAASVPLKIFIVDNELAVVPLLGSVNAAKAGALIVHECSLLDALIALFESEGEKAMPFATSAGGSRSAPAIDDLGAQILGMLLTGFTDQAIATQLNTSMRTVQRRIRQMMDTAKAQNRMQLGFRAARLSWLDAEQDGS